jgi:hypothetical protein
MQNDPRPVINRLLETGITFPYDGTGNIERTWNIVVKQMRIELLGHPVEQISFCC